MFFVSADHGNSTADLPLPLAVALTTEPSCIPCGRLSRLTLTCTVPDCADTAGVITERQAEVGQVVQATAPIFSLARDGDRDAVFNVYESLLAERPADPSIVVSLLDNPAIKTTGTVREITPAVSAQSGTVQVLSLIHI